jgi:thiol-disulfide isomerase/thioredoxin
MQRIPFFLLIISIFLISCTQNKLQDGVWRAELQVQDRQAPFLFEVSGAHTDTASVTLMNGEERVVLTGVRCQGDSVFIPIEAYDAEIRAFVSKGRMEGRFIKNYLENDSGVPFRAVYGNKERFEKTAKPVHFTIDGNWDVLFISEENDTSNNVGIFKSVEGIVTGSILTSAGDLRFLEGNYTANGVQLSAFSGLSPFLLEFTFADENSFEGIFYTTRGKTKLVGTKSDKAGLADGYSIAKMKAGSTTLGFRLPNLDGNPVSLQDARYRGKVVVLSILGSWCPNCLDEAGFLAPWYEANKQRGVEIIGLAFERKDDLNYARGTLKRLKKRFGIGYEIVFGGKAGPEAIAKVLPEIDNFSGYPTTIFIDKQGQVRKIHTGFSGPATGLFYEEFKTEFNQLIDELVAEDLK